MSAEVHSLKSRRNIGKAKGLLQSLVPRAQGFCFYDSERAGVWSSDGVVDYEIDEFVTGLPQDIFATCDEDAQFLRRTIKSGRTLLVIPVAGENERDLGILVVIFSRNAGKSSWFNPNVLYGVLAPAVDLIGEALHLNHEVARNNELADAAAKELKIVYEIDEKIHGLSRSHAGLAQLVGQSGRFLNIAYSVLLIPSKRIRVSATHSSWKNVNRKALDRYLVDTLLPQIEGQRSPVVFEMPAIEGSTAADDGYQTLISPLTDQAGNVEGMLAQLGRMNDLPFDNSNRRFMSHIVRKVEYVIEQSFDARTGLMNRAGFEAQLHESWKTVESSGDRHQLLYVDLDNLQLVNDTFGRKAGDEVIMTFARIIEEDLPRILTRSRQQRCSDTDIELEIHSCVAS